MSKILIVDDNANVCYLLKSYLEEMDYEVIVSQSGMDALEKVKELKPDIMILDVIMEEISGMEVLRRVRLFDKSIGIIMISALIDEARELMPPENFAELLKRGDKSDFRNAIATWRRIHREERINY